jgi:hypothetical protein
VHRQPWYLSVNESTGPGEAQRDVIELPIDDELDVSGWDLRKALRLVSKSNPTLIEWLRSPIIYQQDHTAVSQLWKAAESFHSPLGTWWHYFNMARSNHRGYLRGETVRTKKYLYVLRPLLACQWIEHEQTPRRWPSRICWTGCCRTARCVKPSMPCWWLNAPVPRSVPDRASRRSAISSIVNWPPGRAGAAAARWTGRQRVAGRAVPADAGRARAGLSAAPASGSAGRWPATANPGVPAVAGQRRHTTRVSSSRTP